MADALARGPYIAGESFSNAECAVIPYILRLELLKLDGRPPFVVVGRHDSTK
jgi:glutathione S-transferase